MVRTQSGDCYTLVLKVQSSQKNIFYQQTAMNPNEKKVRALGLCSGGLDSTLAGLVLRDQGVDVEWITFETPFFTAAKARPPDTANK